MPPAGGQTALPISRSRYGEHPREEDITEALYAVDTNKEELAWRSVAVAPVPSSELPLLDRLSTSAKEFGERARTFTTTHVGDPAAKFIRHRTSRNFSHWLLDMNRWRIVIFAVFLVACVAPSLATAIVGYQQYVQLKNLGNDGLAHFKAIQDLANSAVPSIDPLATATPAPDGTPTTTTTAPGATLQDKAKAILTPTILAEVATHCAAARADFTQITQVISGGSGVIGIALYSPFRGKVEATAQLATVAIDVTDLCTELVPIVENLAPIFDGSSIFSPDGGAIFTSDTFSTLTQVITTIRDKMNVIASHISAINPNDLPLNDKQKQQFAQAQRQVPKAANILTGLVPSMPMLKWVMGLDEQRNFLIQTMDRGELRPSGGFNGSYGVLSIDGGRLKKISLTDVGNLDFVDSVFRGDLPPTQYQSWWPQPDWGLRDANLSGDFPTSAEYAIERFRKEGLQNVDGAISFSPLAIEHLLSPDILGSLQVPCYDKVVTKDNLEDVLHYYQLGGGTAIPNCVVDKQDTSDRKQFTAALAQELQARMRTASPDTIFRAAESLHSDMLNKDVEIYFTDPEAEAQLQVNGLGATMVRDNSSDATTIIQANVGANKGSTYVKTDFNETITLDNNGGATHKLVMTLDYEPGNKDVYGWQTMRDYIRVYVPSQAQYIKGSGRGFDQGLARPDGFLCFFSPSNHCTPDEAPICKATVDNPDGLYLPGMIPPSNVDKMGSGPYTGESLDSGGELGSTGYGTMYDIGEPTQIAMSGFTPPKGQKAIKSDEPDRSMMGGLVVIPPGCKATVVLQWYVPNIVSSSQPYSFTFQRQSGTFPNVTVNVTPAADLGLKSLHAVVNGMFRDQQWTLQR